jgi:GcrA cell cycle regulator
LAHLFFQINTSFFFRISERIAITNIGNLVLTFISEYRKVVNLARDSIPGIGAAGKGQSMQSFSWAPEHTAALREFIGRGMSYAAAADALNARFGTAYSRNAAIGRAKRIGLAVPGRSEDQPTWVPKAPKRPKAATQTLPGPRAGQVAPLPAPERAEPVKLRCVGIQPRLVPLVELEKDDCRYPYGGDEEGEAITFCGHPRFGGSSYCAPHFHLTRGPAVEPGRPAGPFVLRLVEAA